MVGNKTFVTLAALVLLSVALNAGASLVLPGYDLPKQSYLEGRTYQRLPEVSVESVSGGVFQSDSEQSVADAIPFRENVMLANAGWQRMAISLANAPFGFDVYHTFLGSRYVIYPDEGRLSEMPYKKEAYEEKAVAAAKRWKEMLKGYPEVDWYTALLDRPATSEWSSAHQLVSDCADYSFFSEVISEYMGGMTTIVELPQCSFDMTRAYYQTDHHMQVDGAFRVYENIISEMGFKPLKAGETYEIAGDVFYGSEARNGLVDVYYDVLRDISYVHANLNVQVDGVDKDISWLCDGFNGDDIVYAGSNKFDNAYSAYFHGDAGLITIENSDCDEDVSLLIVGDSYTNNMERFFAEHFRTVYVIDPRHYEGSLKDFLDTHRIEKAVLLMAANTFSNSGTGEFLPAV